MTTGLFCFQMVWDDWEDEMERKKKHCIRWDSVGYSNTLTLSSISEREIYNRAIEYLRDPKGWHGPQEWMGADSRKVNSLPSVH